MTGPKRVTEKQLAANRRNALQCTGPRTPQGKDASRWNALQHGVLAKAVIPAPLAEFESREDFDELLDGLTGEFAPASPLEQMLVERVAACWWRLARVARVEGGLIADRQEKVEALLASNNWAGLGSRSDFGPPGPAQQLLGLGNVWNNKRQLRALMVLQDESWREATDEALLAGAQALLDELTLAAQRQQALELERYRACRAIPEMQVIAPLSRYEAAIERQLYSALNTLERLKRLRGGDDVPPPDAVSPDDVLDANSA